MLKYPMSETVDSSLRTAVKGSALVLFGMAGSLLLWFPIRIWIVRTTTVEEFGLYSMAVTIVAVLASLAPLGTGQGAARHIAMELGKGRRDSALAMARATLHVNILSATVGFLAVYALSGFMASKVFYKPELMFPLKVVSFSIPFIVMTGTLSAILRGYGSVKQKVYYQDLGRPFYFLALLCIVFLFKLRFEGILYAFTLSSVLVFISISSYGYNRIGIFPFSVKPGAHYGELLRFSLPLMVSGIAVLILTWTDTLMLGRYATATDVGFYGVSISLSNLMLLPLNALIFVFLPIAGELCGAHRLTELNRMYQVLTKWIFAASLPLFFVLFFFPEMTISFLYGGRLVPAALPLRILAVGFLLHAFMGTNGMLHVAMGNTRFIMLVALIMSALNVLLNYVFIKEIGMGTAGAAMASLVSYVAGNTMNSLALYRWHRMHPFTVHYLRPLAGAAVIGILLYATAKSLPLSFWMLPLYFVLFIGGYAASLLLTRSIEREDIVLFEAVSAKTGLRLEALRRLISKFANK
jgi:O-antigen/teichoic acid export membrane protein